MGFPGELHIKGGRYDVIVMSFVMLLFLAVSGCQSSDKVQERVKEGVPGEAGTVLAATFAGGVFLVYGSRF